MPPLSEAAQRALLHIARASLEEEIGGQPPASSPPKLDEMRQRAGAFVTLHKDGQLRGCVGRPEASTALDCTVRECALNAALSDSRFLPVTSEELPRISIEISVLSPIAPARPEDIEIGRHGLVIAAGSRAGLLLPQVPVRWKWDRERFLEETCLKADLPRDAWRSGARIFVFTTQIFNEESFPTAAGADAPSLSGC